MATEAPHSSPSSSSGQTTDVDRSENGTSDAVDLEKVATATDQTSQKGVEEGSKEPKQDEAQQHQSQIPSQLPSQLPQQEQQDQPPSEKPQGPPPNDLFQPKSLKFWMILLSNFLALFLVALDRTIVATAVPRITDDFHSLGDIGWYASAYMLTTAASQLLFGRIYKFYSMKWTFLLCVVVFEIGSAICGAAPSSVIFIVGRAVAGVASAGIFSGCMLIMIPMIPLHKRPMFQGLFGVVFGLASVIGPLVGGAFTSSYLTWRWCFYINLPVGAFTLVFMVFFWNPPPRKHVPAPFWTHVKRLDPLGTALFLPGIVSLLLALEWGGSTYPWKSWRIIPLFILFGVFMLAFTIVQVMMPDTATLPPRVVLQRSILSGALFTFFLSAAMLMLVYYVPVWFQTAKMVNPLNSGVYTIPLVLSLVVSSIGSGIMTQKIGYYVPSMLLAPIIMSVGEGLMSTFTPSTGSSHWIGFQFLAGFGLGFGMQIGNLAAQTVLKPDDISTGVAIMFFVQQLGGAISTTVGQTILSNLLVSQLSHIPGINTQAIVDSGATELADVVPPEFLSVVMDAYNFACTRIFLTGMGLSFAALVCAFFMEWRSIKKPPGGPGPGGAGQPLRGPAPGGPSGPGIPAGLGRPQFSTSDHKLAASPPTHTGTMLSTTTIVASEDVASPAPKKATHEQLHKSFSNRDSAPSIAPPPSVKRDSMDSKISKARRDSEEKLRQARRESDPSYTRPRRNSNRLSKSSRRNSQADS